MPLKRKDRPESWSSNASSPEEKKTREKNHSALESESEDDIWKALNMADNLGSKVDLILNKLNKLDSIELRLETLNKSVANQNTENRKEIIYNFMELEPQIQNARS